MTRAAFAARIAELIGKGYSPRAAERVAKRVAKRERRLANPRHKRAVARKLEAATMRFEATGNVAAFKALKVKR